MLITSGHIHNSFTIAREKRKKERKKQKMILVLDDCASKPGLAPWIGHSQKEDFSRTYRIDEKRYVEQLNMPKYR